jgi:AcrR family transcriptional regulator
MDPKDNLLAASRRVFSRHGFRRTSMAMVAEEAGVSRQAIYHHFPSKELLFSALVDSLQSRAQDEAHAAVDAAEGQSLPTQLFRALSAYHLSLVGSVAGSAFAEELMEESVRHCSDIVSAHAERFQKFLVSIVRAASDSGMVSVTTSWSKSDSWTTRGYWASRRRTRSGLATRAHQRRPWVLPRVWHFARRRVPYEGCASAARLQPGRKDERMGVCEDSQSYSM